MISLNKLKPNRITTTKKSTIKILEFAAGHLFLSFLVLLSIAILLGLAIFYKYNVLPGRTEPELRGEIIWFREDVYQKVLKEWQTRGEGFEAAKTKEYPDPFK